MTEQSPIPAEGWDFFKQSEQEVQPRRDKQGLTKEELDLMYQKCFSTKAGRAVLADLMHWIITVKGFDPSLGFYNGAAYGFFREGQNSMIAYINNRATIGGDK